MIDIASAATLRVPGFLTENLDLTPPDGVLPENPFLAWFGIDESILHQVMDALTQHGADEADIYLQHTRSTEISLEDGIISRARTAVDQGVGLRCVLGERTGYAFTEDLTLEAMKEAARTAASVARGGQAAGPVDIRYTSGARYYDLAVPWAEVGIDRRLPLLTRLEALARAQDPSVKKVSINWADSEERVLVMDKAGRIHIDYRPMSRLWCIVVCERDGVTQSNSANLSKRQGIDWYTDERLAFLAKEAVDRTTILFEARQPPAGELPVVLAAGASGILLHEAVGHGMEADFNRKGVSIYSDMVGKQVAPDFVTIVDSGVIEGERGALNFDDEGTPCERTALVENGVLRTFLHDRISSRIMGVPLTGSGRRESFRHAPLPRMRCTYMENGPHSRDEIIGSVKKGIVAETFTNGQVQIGAGDFTFYIKNGWLIEDGRITAPIKDCNIIGNGPDALRNVVMAAGDGKLDHGGWTCGKDGQSVPVSQGLPTVLVNQLTVGGRSA